MTLYDLITEGCDKSKINIVSKPLFNIFKIENGFLTIENAFVEGVNFGDSLKEKINNSHFVNVFENDCKRTVRIHFANENHIKPKTKKEENIEEKLLEAFYDNNY